MNCEQAVKLGKGTIQFKNYFKQIAAPCKIHADFQCILNSAESNEGFFTKKYQDHIPCSFAFKAICVDDKFSKPMLVIGVKMLLINLLKQLLKSLNTAKNNEKLFQQNFNHD